MRLQSLCMGNLSASRRNPPMPGAPRFGANGEIPHNRVESYFQRMGNKARQVDEAVTKLAWQLQTGGYQNPDREILRLMGAMIRLIPPRCNERREQLTAFLKDLSPDIETSEIDRLPSAFGHYINVNPGEPDLEGRRELDKAIVGLANNIMGQRPLPDARMMRAMLILAREIQHEPTREAVINEFLKPGTPKDVGLEALEVVSTLRNDSQKLDKLRRFGDTYHAVYMNDSDYRVAAVRLIGTLSDPAARGKMLIGALNDHANIVRMMAESALKGH